MYCTYIYLFLLQSDHLIPFVPSSAERNFVPFDSARSMRSETFGEMKTPPLEMGPRAEMKRLHRCSITWTLFRRIKARFRDFGGGSFAKISLKN